MSRLLLWSLTGTLSSALGFGCAHPGPSRSVGAGTAAVGAVATSPPPAVDPAGGQRVSLRAMLSYAQQHAPAIRRAEGRLARARAERTAADVPLRDDPELSLRGGPRWGPDGTTTDYGAELEQTLEVAGEPGLRRTAADRLGELARAELTEVRWQVHQEIHAAFHGALVARARAEAAERLLSFTEGLVEVAHRRLEAGDIAELQLRIAEGELALARQAHIAADGEYQSSRLTLAELAGWPAAWPPEPAGALEQPGELPALEQLVALAEAHHPGLRSVGAATAEASARVRLADREAWPDLTLGLSLERESAPDQAEHIGLLSLRIPLPLWNRNRGARARARADLTIARTERQLLRDNLPVRIARARVAVVSAAARVDAYGADVIPSFEDSLALLRRGFELGEIDLLELLVARGRFLELQHQALDAYADYFRSVAELEAEVGTELFPDERHQDPVPAPAAAPADHDHDPMELP